MKKRMILLGILLAGSLAYGLAGFHGTEQSERQADGDLTAGITEISTELMKEHNAAAQARMVESEMEPPEDTETATLEEAEITHHEVPVATSEYADMAIAQVNNYVNVRALPNTESEVLGKLYNNSVATVLETTEDGWYRISSGNVEGYVKAEYVVVGDESLARAVGTRFATVTTTTLFVRSEPSTEASVLTMVPEGDDLVVLNEPGNGWVLVATVEGDGYVSADYVTLSTEYIHAESKEEEKVRLAKEEAERQAAARAAEEARRAREEAARKEREEAAKKEQQSESASRPSSSNSGSGSGGTSSSVSNGQAVVDYGMQFLGNPYVFGGTSLTNGIDCSAFVQKVYAAFGVSLPRNSAAQRNVGYAVSMDQIQPGDIVCYSGHVGIYAGNNTLLHASNERTGITLTSPITYRPVLTIRRIF